MNKAGLLYAMRTERARWEQTLAEVPPNRFTETMLHGGWSIKDTIGHIAFYERWLLHWLEDAVRGQVTVATHLDLLDQDARNAQIYAENRDRALSEILAESQQVYEQLWQVVKTLPEEDLLDPHRFERYIEPFWGGGLPLWRCIEGDSYGHYAEHIENIRAWLARDVGEHSLAAS